MIVADQMARVEIREDCWLGIVVNVLIGVTIGKGCTVAARAVVARDVPPFTMVGGVPAEVIRYLVNPEEAGDGANVPASNATNGQTVEKGEEALRHEDEGFSEWSCGKRER